jgi:hypothetical protein
LQGAIQMRDGFLCFAQFGKCSAEICLSSGVIGLELDGSRQLLRRSWKIPSDRLRDSQIVMSVKIFGTGIYGSGEVRDGFGDTVRGQQRAVLKLVRCRGGTRAPEIFVPVINSAVIDELAVRIKHRAFRSDGRAGTLTSSR